MDEKKAQVEQFGIHFERLGHSPLAARVFALLLISDPPYQDFYAIREFLSASKSSVSNALNALMKDGIVDYLTFPGNRRRYFRVNAANWLENLQQQSLQIGQMREVLEKVLEDRAESEYTAFNEGLQEIIDFQTFIAQGIELMIRKWEERT